MRDLDAILKNLKTFYYDESFLAVCDERNGMLLFPLGVVYEAMERAINAEAEVERLQKTVNENFDGKCHTCAKAELTKLRKVAEAAKMFCRDTSSRNRLDWLCDALIGLDKEYDGC